MTRRRSIVTILLVVLFLYWIVQDPLGAATDIKQLFHWLQRSAEMIANHLIRFANAFHDKQQ